jgi:hypothetical protein
MAKGTTLGDARRTIVARYELDESEYTVDLFVCIRDYGDKSFTRTTDDSFGDWLKMKFLSGHASVRAHSHTHKHTKTHTTTHTQTHTHTHTHAYTRAGGHTVRAAPFVSNTSARSDRRGRFVGLVSKWMRFRVGCAKG